MNKSTQFPLLGILGLIFVTLKLAGIGVVATWSWLWVLSPFWIPLSIALGLVLLVWIIVGLAHSFK